MTIWVRTETPLLPGRAAVRCNFAWLLLSQGAAQTHQASRAHRRGGPPRSACGRAAPPRASGRPGRSMVTRILSRRSCENCASTSVGVPMLNQGCGLARGERILKAKHNCAATCCTVSHSLKRAGFSSPGQRPLSVRHHNVSLSPSRSNVPPAPAPIEQSVLQFPTHLRQARLRSVRSTGDPASRAAQSHVATGIRRRPSVSPCHATRTGVIVPFV